MAGLFKIVLNSFLLVGGFLICIIFPMMLLDSGLPNTVSHLIGAVFLAVLAIIFLRWWHGGEKEAVIEPMPMMVSKGLLTKVVEPDGTVKVYEHKRFAGTKQDMQDFAEEEL